MRKSALLAFGLVVAIIVALGLVVLSSASEANGMRVYHDPYAFMKRQFVFLGMGIVLAVAAALVDYRIWKEKPLFTWFVYVVVFVMLVMALYPPFGRNLNGSFRWLSFGPISIQPNELAKISIVLMLSMWLDKINWRVERFLWGSVIPVAFIGVLAVPIVREPDYGAVMVFALAAMLLMFAAGVRLLHMVPWALLGLVGLVYEVLTNANRMARLSSFLRIKMPIGVGAQVTDAATKNAGYQGDMAITAFANGRIWGRGLSQSMQKQFWLPEAHADMIFAVGAEELGIAFSIATVVLFVLFFALAIYIARSASDRFGRFLVMGLAFIVFFQAIFNIGVVCGALPMKGVALPFFSYGGTNMLVSFFSVGTILSVGIHSYRDRKRKVPHG